MAPPKSSDSFARSTGEADQDRPKLERARSTMDTFVIAGRTRLPSSSALMPEAVDLQIAEGLLTSDPCVPSSKLVSDNLNPVEYSGQNAAEDSGSKPLRRHTRLDETSSTQLHYGLNFLPASATGDNQRGLVIGRDVVVSTQPLVISRARGRNYIPVGSRHASQRSSNKTSATWSTVSHRIFTDSTGSSRMHETMEFIEQYNELALKHGLPRYAEACPAKRSDSVERTNITIKTKAHSNWLMRKILRRSSSTYSVKVKSKSITRKLSMARITDLPKRTQRDLLKGQTLEEIGRLSGLSLFTLPPEFAVSKLSIPTCISATATYIVQHGEFLPSVLLLLPNFLSPTEAQAGRTTPGIFRIPGQLFTVNAIYDFYAQTFSSIDTVSHDVEQTIGSGLLPTHIDYTVHDVASVFKKLVSDLSGGLLGSLVLFKAFRNIEDHFYADPELSESKQIQIKARLIALAIFCIESTHRVSLICAVLGLVSLVGQAAEKAAASARGNKSQMSSELMGYRALAVVFAPLLLGDLNEHFDLYGRDERGGLLTLPESSKKSSKKEKKKEKEKKNAKMNNKLEQSPEMIAKYERLDVTIRVTQMLITLWQDIVKQLCSIGTLHDEKRVVSGHSNIKSSETGSHIEAARGRSVAVHVHDPTIVKRKERTSSRSTCSFKSTRRPSTSSIPKTLHSQPIKRSRSPLSTQMPSSVPIEKADNGSHSITSMERFSMNRKPTPASSNMVSSALLQGVQQQQRGTSVEVLDEPHGSFRLSSPGSVGAGEEGSGSPAFPHTPIRKAIENNPFDASQFDIRAPHYSNGDAVSMRSPRTSAKGSVTRLPRKGSLPNSASSPQHNKEATSAISLHTHKTQSNGYFSMEGTSPEYTASPQNKRGEPVSKLSPHIPPYSSTADLFKKFGPTQYRGEDDVSPGSPYTSKRRDDTDSASHHSRVDEESGTETVIQTREANIGKPMYLATNYESTVRRLSKEFDTFEVNRASPKAAEKDFLEDEALSGLERQQSVKVLTKRFSPKTPPPTEAVGVSPRSLYSLKDKSTARLDTPTKIPQPARNSVLKRYVTGSPTTRTQNSSNVSLIPRPAFSPRSKKTAPGPSESKNSLEPSNSLTLPIFELTYETPEEMGVQCSKICGGGARKSSKNQNNNTSVPSSRRGTEPFVGRQEALRQFDGVTRSPSGAESIKRAPTKKNMLANVTADSVRRGLNEADVQSPGRRIDIQSPEYRNRMYGRHDEIFPGLSSPIDPFSTQPSSNTATLHVRIRQLQREKEEYGAVLTATTNELEALRRANSGTTRFLQEITHLKNEVQYWKQKALWAESRLIAIGEQIGGDMALGATEGGLDGDMNEYEDNESHVMDGTDLQGSEYEGPESDYPYVHRGAHNPGYGTYSSHDAGFDGYYSRNNPYAPGCNTPIRATAGSSSSDHNDIDPYGRFDPHRSYNSQGSGSHSGHQSYTRSAAFDPNDIDPMDRFNPRKGVKTPTAHDGAPDGFF